jgi:acyl-homoserine-lactone acylase
MPRSHLLLAFALLACAPRAPASPDVARWEAQATRVTITRDIWGIPHVRGTSDADAVFGLMYAQAEDDFNRIEVNYLNAMGRLAEAEGERAIWRDLRMKLFVQPDSMQALYASSPASLQALMTAWADGLNYFLHTHPDVKPRVLTRFEPWMALSFSEGSIGGDIETISLRQLEAFYGGAPVPPSEVATSPVPREPTGSNGFAIAPSKSASGHALLLINPHTSFFFREEAQITSEQGLNAYGAVTWGQFFIYQGFNATAGWMHTSTGADVLDEYAETVVEQGGRKFYRYNGALRPLVERTIALPYKAAGAMQTRSVTVYATHHGPIVRRADGTWISVRLMQEPVKALTQSFTRTKAKNLGEFRTTMELHTNSSNNTVFADAEGNMAYFLANHVPRRIPAFDWRKPVDGTDSTTEWGPLHGIDDSPLAINPPTGWLQNTNNWPYSVAGAASPRQADFPAYMDAYGENPRGIHALKVLSEGRAFTLESLRDAAYDSYLPAFADLLPSLITAYDEAPASDPLKAKLAEPIAALRGWDYRWAATSVPTTLAVYWGDALWTATRADAESEEMTVYAYMATKTTPALRLEILAAAVDQLTADFGTWETSWGDVNRFQRLTADIVQPFSDSGVSIPVPFPSARWGSLASFGAATYPGTKKRYGTGGNSFVAVVEFGDSVRAMAVTAGGLHSVPGTKHFNDQAARYAAGDLREVYFYPSQLAGHTERRYRPGEPFKP